MAECNCSEGKTILLYACSGGANVGEASDRACRQLMFEGYGPMWCLVGLGGDVQDLVQTAKDADMNVVVDGCDKYCGKKTFDRCGLSNYVQVKVTDLGIEKAKPKAATDEEVAKVIEKVREVVADA